MCRALDELTDRDFLAIPPRRGRMPSGFKAQWRPFVGDSDKVEVATPSGWTYEGSLSERFSFVPNEDVQGRLKYLRTDDGIDVFLDTSTGREVYKSQN